MAPPSRRAKPGNSVVKKTIVTRLSPKVTRQSLKKKSSKISKTSKTESVGHVNKSPSKNSKKETSIQKEIRSKQSGPPTLDTLLLQNLSAKQQTGVSKDFREKINKVGNSLLALAASKKELLETDLKVAQLEETYGKTMKVQDVWQYQERAGLAAIIGQDPQAVMNAPHIFKDEERLMYNSAHPRSSGISQEKSPEPSPSPRRQTRTRSQWMQTKDERLSTDDEDN